MPPATLIGTTPWALARHSANVVQGTGRAPCYRSQKRIGHRITAARAQHSPMRGVLTYQGMACSPRRVRTWRAARAWLACCPVLLGCGRYLTCTPIASPISMACNVTASSGGIWNRLGVIGPPSNPRLSAELYPREGAVAGSMHAVCSASRPRRFSLALIVARASILENERTILSEPYTIGHSDEDPILFFSHT